MVGSLDQQTQRQAWPIGDKQDFVFETGLADLAKDERPVLMHFGKEKTDRTFLVRPEEPKDGK